MFGTSILYIRKKNLVWMTSYCGNSNSMSLVGLPVIFTIFSNNKWTYFLNVTLQFENDFILFWISLLFDLVITANGISTRILETIKRMSNSPRDFWYFVTTLTWNWHRNGMRKIGQRMDRFDGLGFNIDMTVK